MKNLIHTLVAGSLIASAALLAACGDKEPQNQSAGGRAEPHGDEREK